MHLHFTTRYVEECLENIFFDDVQVSQKDQEAYDEVVSSYMLLIRSGLPPDFELLTYLVQMKIPRIYDRLVGFKKNMDHREKFLPQAVKKFVKNRRTGVNSLYSHGVLNKRALVHSLRQTVTDINAMSTTEKASLFGFYPYMKIFTEGPITKEFVGNPDGAEKELLAELN
ncbi:hypothetical protein QR680_015526 [Steinernema hermaphroditum]|uniref:Uncharacterized protein n=1 Tax=Steinernema hermaphroditum TaxID=289476 RepID=A0AA39H814_9BILA|nr:hypothetical protein QR680_015526 [Steinernema hermaphroditum]